MLVYIQPVGRVQTLNCRNASPSDDLQSAVIYRTGVRLTHHSMRIGGGSVLEVLLVLIGLNLADALVPSIVERSNPSLASEAVDIGAAAGDFESFSIGVGRPVFVSLFLYMTSTFHYCRES